ncbi:MAG: hypothetical protein RIR55_818, partial [Bacteroidota bacterium]
MKKTIQSIVLMVIISSSIVACTKSDTAT